MLIMNFYVVRIEEGGTDWDNYHNVRESYFLTREEALRELKYEYEKLYKHFDKQEVGGIACTPRASAEIDEEKGRYEIWWYESLWSGKILVKHFEDHYAFRDKYKVEPRETEEE